MSNIKLKMTPNILCRIRKKLNQIDRDESRKDRKNEKGYSMIEVIVAVAVLSILTLIISQTLTLSTEYFRLGNQMIEENSETTNNIEGENDALLTKTDGEVSFRVDGNNYTVDGQYYNEEELKLFKPTEI